MSTHSTSAAPSSDVPITLVRRLGVALGVALAVGPIAFVRDRVHQKRTTVIGHMWYAACNLFGGRDPDLSVGPRRTFFGPRVGTTVAAAVSLGIQLWIVVLS